MNNPFHYNLTSNTLGNEEILSILNVIKSGQFTYADKVMSFEKKYSKKFNIKYSVMTNSGSSANLIALASIFFLKKNFLKKGDEVIVPAIGWATTYSPLQQYGLKLKIVDVDPQTLNIDVKKLLSAITKKTKLIVVVNILGNPADLEQIASICKKKNIYLMEDNCESLGAKQNNKFTGTFGIVNTMSFFYSHHMTTIEGGMVSTNNPEIYKILRSLRSHGWDRDIKIKKKFEQYNFIYPGYNLRPTEINAAIGLEQLKKVDEMIEVRRKNYAIYKKIFSNNKIFHIQKENENSSSSSFALTFVFKKKYLGLKNKILNELKEKNIQYRLITGGSFEKHPVKKYFNYSIYKNTKHANYIHDNGFFVGNMPKDLSDELLYLNKAIVKFY